MRIHANFRAEVYQRYESTSGGLSKSILEGAIAKVADEDGVWLLVQSHAVEDKPFSWHLDAALRHAAVGKRPASDGPGSIETYSVPATELRKRLFAMTRNDVTEAKLAIACLDAIDELRDDYGPPQSEPRHPDIDADRPWPLAAV